MRAVLTPQAAPAEKEEKNERNFRYHDIGGIRRQFRAVEVYGYLSLSRRFKKAFIDLGMGAAVIFVMTCATAITYPVYWHVLVPNKLEYLNTVAFILIIALFVQLVEIALKK